MEKNFQVSARKVLVKMNVLLRKQRRGSSPRLTRPMLCGFRPPAGTFRFRPVSSLPQKEEFVDRSATHTYPRDDSKETCDYCGWSCRNQFQAKRVMKKTNNTVVLNVTRRSLYALKTPRVTKISDRTDGRTCRWPETDPHAIE